MTAKFHFKEDRRSFPRLPIVCRVAAILLPLAVMGVLTLTLTTPLQAQQATGAISGTVTDQQGGVIPGARIRVRNVDTSAIFQTTTNGDGFYAAPGLSVGNYEVTAEVNGFKTVVRRGITLQVDEKAAVDFRLEVGQVTQTVAVTAEVPLVDTQSATMGTVISTRTIEDMPINGRNSLALTLLTPGVSSPVGAVNAGFADRGTNVTDISINGGAVSMNELLFDGVPNSESWLAEVAVPPDVDAVQEFKVQSGPMPAEFGLTAGGVVNLVSKSGTNTFRGTAYEFVRNTVFDARNEFSTTRPPLQYNQYGGALGGPVIKNKTFFFFNYDGYQLRNHLVVITTVPTLAERQGDFSNDRGSSGTLIPIYDPATTQPNPKGSGYVRTQFPGNIIPSSRLDPVAQNILALYPLPNQTPNNAYTNTNNYGWEESQPINSHQYHIRIDENFRENDRLFGRLSGFVHQPFQTSTLPGPEMGRHDDDATKSAVLDYTHVFSPKFINNVRLGLTRQNFHFTDASYGQGWPQKLGLPQSNPAYVLPLVAISGFPSLGNGVVGVRVGTLGDVYEMVTRILGNHTLTFGGEFRPIQGGNSQTSDPSGSFTFNTTLTNNPQSTSGTGDGMGSFVLGDVASASGQIVAGAYLSYKTYSAFVQDDWQAKPRLTLNLGLRYDIFGEPFERHNGLSTFLTNVTSPVSGLLGETVYAGVNGQPRSWTYNHLKDFAPRIGFAYHLFGKGNAVTVLRGGYAIFYPNMYDAHELGGDQSGFSAMSTSYTAPGANGNYPAFMLQNGFPSLFLPPLGASGGSDAFLGQSITIAQNSAQQKAPYSQQWDFSVEQGLPGNWMVDVTYSGNKGTHNADAGWNYDQLDDSYLSLGLALQNQVPNPYAGKVPGSLGASTITLQQSLLPFPYYSALSIRSPFVGSSIAHFLELNLKKRMSSGLMLLFNYTGGKLIDDGWVVPINFVGDYDSYQAGYQDGKFNRKAERSLDVDDVSSRAVISVLYQLPYGRGRHWQGGLPWVNEILGDWQVNTIGTMQSGIPLVIRGASNHLANRPNQICNANLSHRTRSEWFNTACFVNPPNYTYGDVSRDLPNVRSPATINFDSSLTKDLSLKERVTLQFRAEAFNTFNHVNLGFPDGGFVPGSNGLNSSGTFGVISSAGDPRLMQLALKLNF